MLINQLILNEFQNAVRVIFKLAFPNCNDSPSSIFEFFLFAAVALNGSLEFVEPEPCACLRSGRTGAAFVPVPEAAMHEYYSPVFLQNDVRLSW